MTDTDTAVKEIEDAGVTWSLLKDRVRIDIIPREDGDLRVRFRDETDEVLWSSIFERGFWESRTKKGEIKNKFANNTSFAKSEVKQELEEVWTDLIQNAEDYETDLLSPTVEQLIENTQAVEVHGGEDSEIHVFVEEEPCGTCSNTVQTNDGASVRKLAFSHKEWAMSTGNTQNPPVVEKYTNAFYEVLDISWREWREDIRPRWKEMQEIVTDEQMSTADRIAMSVVRKLRHRLNVYADREKILTGTWNGWYEPNSSHGEVVWVPGDTLDEIMDEHDKGTKYRSALSRALKSDGYTLGSSRQTTIQGDPVELYPFLPETIGIEDTEVDVIGIDGDDDEGDATESEPSDDDQNVDGDELLDEVVSVVEQLDPEGEGVTETEVITEAATNREIGSPDAIADAIERGVLCGVLYRPGDEDDELVAVRPGGTEPPGDDDIDPDEDGVPEP